LSGVAYDLEGLDACAGQFLKSKKVILCQKRDERFIPFTLLVVVPPYSKC
jgi:hypothetical protein